MDSKQSDAFICLLSVFSGCISTALHQSVRVCQWVSLWKCLCVWMCIFATATSLPLSPSYYHKRSLSLLYSLSNSLSLSLIYIAMTPVSVIPAPCCEFHLSRKTSGDCYANGYVVGLVRRKKKWRCLYPYVCTGSRREEKIEGMRYRDRNSKKEEKRKKSKETKQKKMKQKKT